MDKINLNQFFSEYENNVEKLCDEIRSTAKMDNAEITVKLTTFEMKFAVDMLRNYHCQLKDILKSQNIDI